MNKVKSLLNSLERQSMKIALDIMCGLGFFILLALIYVALLHTFIF